MKTYLDCWIQVATALFSQALAGEPELSESLPKPLGAGAFGFAAAIAGDEEGRFSVVLDPLVLDSPLVGEGVDQKAGWGEILKEVADAAAGELLAKTGKKCRVENFEEIDGESKLSCAFQLNSGALVFPNNTAPADSRRATNTVLSGAGSVDVVSDPRRVGQPCTAANSLIVIGIPSRSPAGCPALQRRSE